MRRIFEEVAQSLVIRTKGGYVLVKAKETRKDRVL